MQLNDDFQLGRTALYLSQHVFARLGLNVGGTNPARRTKATASSVLGPSALSRLAFSRRGSEGRSRVIVYLRGDVIP